MRKRQVVGSFFGAAGILASVLSGSAVAVGQPEMETISFSESFPDEFLSEECGVDVTTSLSGRVTFFMFDDQAVGPQNIASIHVDLVATADGDAARFKDVGIDLVRVEPDGTVVLMIIGQVPFAFTGALMIDLVTGEVILEAQHVLDTTRVCQLLTK